MDYNQTPTGKRAKDQNSKRSHHVNWLKQVHVTEKFERAFPRTAQRHTRAFPHTARPHAKREQTRNTLFRPLVVPNLTRAVCRVRCYCPHLKERQLALVSLRVWLQDTPGSAHLKVCLPLLELARHKLCTDLFKSMQLEHQSDLT